MNYWSIYFGIALFILVSKFVQALFTIGKLQNFLLSNRQFVEKYVCNKDKLYIRLFGLHFTQLNYGKDYETKMIEELYGEEIKYGSSNQVLFFIIFALLWPITVPLTLIYLVFEICHRLFNLLLKKFLNRCEKYGQLS